MTAIRVSVTAEHIAKAGLVPSAPQGDPEWRFPQDWSNPVDLAIAEVAGVEVEMDGGGRDEEFSAWIATIGLREGCTLVVDLPGIVSERLDPYYAQDIPLEPFDFDIAVDDWLLRLLGIPQHYWAIEPGSKQPNAHEAEAMLAALDEAIAAGKEIVVAPGLTLHRRRIEGPDGGLKEAARAAVAEREAAERDWMEWWARGRKGSFTWPREKHLVLQSLLDEDPP
jgi:hypothetical protein